MVTVLIHVIRRMLPTVLWTTVAAVTLSSGVFIYLSTRPVMQLKGAPPATYYDEYFRFNPRRRTHEEKLARAYWSSAVCDIAGRFTYGKDLPEEPPPEFRARAADFGAVTSTPSDRIRYWGSLRVAWVGPQSWQSTRKWHTDWFRDLLKSPRVHGSNPAGDGPTTSNKIFERVVSLPLKAATSAR
jgi:hypothetical protein